jgi:hypoxanthine-DNA glycosylase
VKPKSGRLVALTGLPPVADADARVLILGSMPGARSLRLGQYYAHSGNRFWRVAGALLGFDPRGSYVERVEALRVRRVALWDVLAECRRTDSLDAHIERSSEVANDLEGFLDAHPRVATIALNGGAAARAFRRRAPARVAADRVVLELPSTSGANAAWTLDRLLDRWREALPGV